MVNIQSPTAEIRRGNKKEEERRTNSMKILWSALLHRVTIIIPHYTAAGFPHFTFTYYITQLLDYLTIKYFLNMFWITSNIQSTLLQSIVYILPTYHENPPVNFCLKVSW